MHAFELDERTVAEWRGRAGRHCEQVHQAIIEQGKLDLVHVQADEIRIKARGSIAWMGLAMMVSTRLWLAGVVSQTRDRGLADQLLQQVRRCCQKLCELLICTDGWAPYPNSIRRAKRRENQKNSRKRKMLFRSVARELLLDGLARSNYVTAITDWFMTFAGKWAELVLYATVLYSCAQLYPGVHLPVGLSLAVFLIQMGAPDIGGLSLAKLAKQAREDGNTDGAAGAEQLSKWLIGIMLVGVVTVGLEHALPIAIPAWVITSIDVLLVVARSVCAVLYGRVVHGLKQEITTHLSFDLSQELSEKLRSELTATLDLVRQEFSNQASERSQVFSHQLSELSQELQNQGGLLIPIQEAITAHEQALTGLAALAGEVSRYERNMRQALAGLRTSIESGATDKPKLRLVSTEKFSGEPGELSTKGFIESYVTKHPEARNAEIIEEATKLGLTLSQSYVSQVRKAVKEQSA